MVWLLALLGVGLLEVVAGGMRHITRSATVLQPTRGFATRSSRTRSVSTPPTTIASARAS
jgi:hypothetical protein